MMRQKNEALGTAPLGRLILSFTFPVFLAMLVQTLYNVVDTVFVGRYVGPLGIAGLTIVFPLQLFAVGIGQMTGMGGSSLISRLLGAGRPKEAEHALGNAISLTLFLALFISVIGLVNVTFWCELLGASEAVLPYSKTYLEIVLVGMIFMTFGMAFSFLIRSGGNARVPMIGQMIGASLNIVLDAIFIIPLDMGVRGAALATLIAQIISFIYYVVYYISGKSEVPLRLRNLIPIWRYIKDIFSIGVSSLTMILANSVCSIFVNRTIVSYGGDIAMSAYGIINRVNMFAIMPSIVIGQGLQPIIGYNYGAKKYDRVIRGMLMGLGTTVVIGVVVFLVVILVPEPIISIFTNDQALIDLSAYAVKRVFAVMYLTGIVLIGSSIFQSLGKALRAFISTVSRSAVILLPLVMILPRFMGLDGVWWALPITDLLAALLVIFLTIPVVKDLRRKHAQSFVIQGA